MLYVDLTRISDSELRAALPQLSKSKAIVFDLRGYPRRLRTFVVKYLVDSTVTSTQDLTPIVQRADHRDVRYEPHSVTIVPDSVRLSARIAFLADANAQSMAEEMLAPVETQRIARIVGTPTSGSSGNVTWLKVPGGLTVTFSGAKVIKSDGAQFVGVGILPTTHVSPTIAGVAAGRDEVLEQAIELLSKP
jgi:C-terminal processing protease CtpA/Prc